MPREPCDEGHEIRIDRAIHEPARLLITAHLYVVESADYGSEDVIYANVAFEVAEAVAAGKFDRGILVCGTGIGMSIAANKVPGVAAALCSDVYSTERSIKSNNCSIMTMGAFTTGKELAKALVKTWMSAEYTPGGRSEPKIQRITDYDNEHSS